MLCCLCYVAKATDQSSRAETSIEEARNLRKENPKQSIQILSDALDNQELTELEIAENYYLQGNILYYELANKEAALGKFYNALKYFRQGHDQDLEYRTLVFIALSFQNLYHYDYATDYLNEALSLPKLDSNRIRRTQYNLGRVFRAQERYFEAKNVFHELSQFYENDDQKLYALSKGALADTYAKNEEFDQSEKIYKEVLELMALNGDYAGLTSKAVNSLGYIKLMQGQLQKSEQYLLEGLALKDEAINQQSLLMSYLNLGELYQAMERPEKAIEYYQLGSALDESAVNHINLIEALRQLVAMAKEKNDLVSALQYQERIDQIQDPYVALSERLEQMHARYSAERVKYMYDELQLKNQLIQSQNRNIIIGLILFALTILAAVVIIRQQQKRMVDKSVRTWLMEKNRLLYFIAGRYKLNLKEVQKELEKR